MAILGCLLAIVAFTNCASVLPTTGNMVELAEKRTEQSIDKVKLDLKYIENPKNLIFKNVTRQTSQVDYGRCLRGALDLNESALSELISATADPESAAIIMAATMAT